MIQNIYCVLKLSTMKNSFNAQIFTLLYLLGFSFLSASGFDGNTLITTSSGRLKPIKELQVGDAVISYNSNLQPEINLIKAICAFMVDATMSITTQENVSMTTGLMEPFYLPVENQWVYAKDLRAGDCLLSVDLGPVAITKVEKREGIDVMFLIMVDNQHNFVVSQGKYLAHNGAIGAAVGVVVGSSAVYAVYGGLTWVVTTVSGPVAPATLAVWHGWTAGPVVVLAHKGALIGGLIGATLTGPV